MLPSEALVLSQNLRSEPVVLASKLPPLTSPAQSLCLWAPRPLRISLMNQSCVAHLVGNPRPHHANGGILVIHFTRSCLRSLTQQADPDSWHGKHPISPDLILALIFFLGAVESVQAPIWEVNKKNRAMTGGCLWHFYT